MNFLKSILNEAKSVRGGVNIGDDYRVMRLGFDPNGNWSYWVSYAGGKAKKIQSINLDGAKHRVTNIHDFLTDDSNAEKQKIKAYYQEYIAK